MAPHLERLGETTLMRGHDKCQVEVIGSCQRFHSRVLAFLVPEKKRHSSIYLYICI